MYVEMFFVRKFFFSSCSSYVEDNKIKIILFYIASLRNLFAFKKHRKSGCLTYRF